MRAHLLPRDELRLQKKALLVEQGLIKLGRDSSFPNTDNLFIGSGGLPSADLQSFLRLKMLSIDSKVKQLELIDPRRLINISNEIKALRELLLMLKRASERFPTSLDQDLEQLDLMLHLEPENERSHMALDILINEKEMINKALRRVGFSLQQMERSTSQTLSKSPKTHKISQESREI